MAVGISRREAGILLDTLLDERPSFHGAAAEVNWQLDDQQLRWLLEELPAAARTLETGCGYSTILFAAIAEHHTVVAPTAEEHERVSAWCVAHGLGVDHVRFVAEPSQHWLPRAASSAQLGNLDCVLIDGDHAFPIPSIDWYYTAEALRVGGVCVVDDVAIRACGQVAQFLDLEQGRWTRAATLPNSAVFRKISTSVLEDHSWRRQGWNTMTTPPPAFLATLRERLRLRSRWHAIRARGSTK